MRSSEGELPSLPPAAFNLSITGDLANWKRRGWVWLSQPPEMDIQGQIQMAVSGRLDTSHVEVLQANWDSKPVSVRTADFAMAEPRLIGNFKGRIDTADLTRLQVEQLTVQANSFWIVAQDQAAEDGAARRQARWMLDIERFMQNLQSANNRLGTSTGTSTGANNILTSSAPSGGQQTSYQAKGSVQEVSLGWWAKSEQALRCRLTVKTSQHSADLPTRQRTCHFGARLRSVLECKVNGPQRMGPLIFLVSS